MNTLHKIVEQRLNIIRQVIDAGGEISEELEQALVNLDVALPEKIDGYAYVVDDLKAEQKLWKKRSDDFAKVAKSCGKAIEFLKEGLKIAASKLKVAEFEGNDYRVKISGGTHSVIITNEDKIPEEFKVITASIDKAKIKKALKEGRAVPGAELLEGETVRFYVNRKRG